MERIGSGFPVRQATRVINEFQLRAGSASFVAAGRDFHRSAVLMLMLRAALKGDGRRFSLQAVAASLHRPRETVRRAGRALMVAGFCEIDRSSVHLVPAFETLPAVVRLSDDLDRIFRALVAGFEASGIALPADVAMHSARERVAAALDIYLSVFELSEVQPAQLMMLYLVGAVTVLNAARLTHDPDLSRRYEGAGDVPPDDLRRPASLRDVEALDGFPYSTLWRHAVLAEMLGILEKTPEGYLLARKYLTYSGLSRDPLEKVRYVRRVFHDLAAGRYAEGAADA